MSRPQTSKPRGLCKYYATPRGCFAGSQCKFLHGADQTLTPFDQSKSCKFFAAGFCRRGDECWFRHVAPGAAAESSQTEAEGSDDVCNVCLEKPVTYGLLTGCGHVFCITCIRQWRNANDRSSDMSAVVKKCPLCRTSSSYVVPSSIPYPHSHPGKFEAIERYKASMAKIPCVHFQESSPSNRLCPFGRDCFYAHINADGTPHVFPQGVEHYFGRYRARLLNNQRVSSRLVEGDNAGPGLGLGDEAYTSTHIFNRLLQGAPLDDVQGTIETMRANLPAMLMDLGMEMSEEPASDEEGDDGAHYTDISRARGGIVHGSADVLARLAEVMLETINGMRDRIGMPSDTQNSDGHQEEDGDLPTIQHAGPLSNSNSSSEVSQPESAPSNTDSRPSTISPRFSTSVGPQRLYIDVDEDEEDVEDSDEDGGEDAEAVVSEIPQQDLSDTDLAPESLVLVRDASATNSPTPNNSLLGVSDVSPTANVSILPTPLAIASSPSAESTAAVQFEHNAEPPFLTDGRGRVVWSSTSTRSPGRAIREREAPSSAVPTSPTGESISREASRVRKPRRAATTRESVTEPMNIETATPAFTTDGRGRVIWTSSSSPVSPSVVTDRESVPQGVTEEETSNEERSLLGRVYNAVFS